MTIFLIVWKMNVYNTLSYAFEKSSLRNTVGCLEDYGAFGPPLSKEPTLHFILGHI